MAFTANTFNLISSGKNTDCFALWGYQTSDNEATIEGTGYFNSIQDGDNGGVLIGRLRVNDIILVYGGDVQAFYRVTSLTTNVAISRFAADIETAMIEDLAVTTAKLAADAVTNAKLADDAVSLENLDSGITPSHVAVYAGEHTWTGGGTSDTITVSGALASDIVQCTIQSVPSEAAYLAGAAVTADTVTVTLSAANTSNDGVIAYTVFRAAS